MQKSTKFNIFLIPFLALSLTAFAACQPLTDGSSSGEALETPLVHNIDAYHRFDQSVISPVNNQIQQNTSGQLNRSIPNMNDSNISYCESVNGEVGKYNGIRDTKKYPLASVSKMFLTAWALDGLGPDYKFENLWYFKKVSDGVYDVYFKANYDPALNIEKMLYAMAVLRAQGVQKIRELAIDETTRVYLSVLNDPHVELGEVPVSMDQSVENLRIIFNSSNWSDQTETAKNNLREFAQQKGRLITVPDSFAVDQVVYTDSKKVIINNYTSVIKMKSSVLLKYLKDINVNSNNYMTDMLFKILGGQREFKKFQEQRLGLTSNDLEFYTGSGLPVISMGLRTDNLGSCISVLKTLKFIKILSQQLSFDMGHVLLTAGIDHGTYEPTIPMSLNHNMVLKTGRLYDLPALNVAGTTSLSN
ncbi:MAG: D-alanyl-D-alanine carboxypeptidase, partial [Bdellovibrionaceae bacterium]|nr:D-alanyl-D-alanine carboxypeptidase [Pseudobdellovibrionaceae bacterium]